MLDLLVRNDAPFRGIHQEHTARLEPPFELHLLGLDRKHAGLRGQDGGAVVRDPVARRAEAVAVQRGADHAAVGECDRGRPVPGLHQRGVVFVESPLLIGHRRIAAPSLGNQHGHRVRQAAARQGQQLHGVVDLGGVAAAGRADGENLLDVVAKQRAKPGPIAARTSTPTLPLSVLISPLWQR